MERDRNGRLPWAIVLLIIVLACLAAWIGSRLITAPKRNVSAEVPCSVVQLDAAHTLETVSDGFVYYSGDTISKVGLDTKTKWSYLIGSDAGMKAGDSGVAAWLGRRLVLIDGKTGTPSYSGNMDANVLSATIGGNYAAALLEPEHNSTIVLMETGGRKVDSITLSGQTVVDYGFFYNNTLFWVLALDTNGTVPSCTVNIYNPGKRIAGSITDSDQLFYHISFQSAHISCVGDTYLKVYSYTGEEEEEKRRLVYGWTLADADDASDNPLMAFVPNGQYDATAEIRDVRMICGDWDQIVRMPFGCSELIAMGSKVYGFSNEGYVMIAALGEARAQVKKLPVSFDRVYGVTEDGSVILGYGSTIYIANVN